MGHKHPFRPKRLGAKLFQIREGLGLSQSQLISLLNVRMSTARISEYETGAREPSLHNSFLAAISIRDLARAVGEKKLRGREAQIPAVWFILGQDRQ